MSVPPEREAPAWQVLGERAPSRKPDRAGPVLVAAVLVALVVAVLLLFVL